MVAGQDFDFQKRQARGRDQPVLFFSRYISPCIASTQMRRISGIIAQRLVVMMKELRKAFDGYFLD